MSWNRGAGWEKDGKRRRGRGRGDMDISHLGNGSMGMFFAVPKQRRGKGSRGRQRNDSDLSRSIPDENRPKTAAELSRELVKQTDSQFTYHIGGVKIQFPGKPYPSQFSMMDKIVKGLERGQNCLLESPTGSGKSLALLCSVLAWQQAQKAKNREDNGESNECCCKCNNATTTEESMYDATVAPNTTVEGKHDETEQAGSTPDNSILIDDDADDDDFKKPSKKLRTSLQGEGSAGGRQHISIRYEDTPTGSVATPTATGATPTVRGATPMDADRGACSCQCQQGGGNVRKVPTIYFGTRTHKQIAQIARELAKTAYRSVRMTILSSREQTCIDPEVSKLPKKTEECKNKRDECGCVFFDNVRKVSHQHLEANGLEHAWDLEDLITYSKRHRACPYYGARGLREEADIIFCPYNYLIDPVIRTQMEINLKDEVVIVDEAHNIEDSAREAASYSVTNVELETAMGDFNKVIDLNIKVTEHVALKNVVYSLGQWIETFRDTLVGDDFDNASKVWNGIDMVAQLKAANIGPENLDKLRSHMNAVIDEDPDNPPLAKISIQTAVILEKTFFVLGYIYRHDYKYMNDYRIALVRTMVYTSESTDGQWMGKNRRGSSKQSWLFTLNFWCMNPAVAFSDLEPVKSVILTSGTLSPMNTFQSELEQPFPIQLEANHVINSKQVWVGAISKGPRGGSLLGTYQTAETFDYQDEVGLLALNVCKTVPHGVLCFLSSYRMLDKLITRWQVTGLYKEIARHKVVMREPRASDREKVNFDELLKEFYATIKETENADAASGERTGVFFMAVCRGKVSEGMDFADNNARAVIAVGIPFPALKDIQVELKKKYNNEHSRQRGLLTGNDWYEIQAYRAINQALGRCIRHRYDWGALILVDERYAKNPAKYTKGLSKWVRNKVNFHGNFNQMQRSLQEFTDNMVTTPPGPGQDLTLTASQMDLSVVVETPHAPSPPPVLLPRPPAASTSPPMDLDSLLPLPTPGAATALLPPSTPVCRQVETSYALPSQAGGFVMSQTQGNCTAVTQPDRGLVTGTPVVVGTEEIVSAPPPDSQPMDMDQTLDFAPPLAASTQHPGRPGFAPGFTSTQMGTQGQNQTAGIGALDVSVISLVGGVNNGVNEESVGFATPAARKTHRNTQKVTPTSGSQPLSGRLSLSSVKKSVKQKLARYSHQDMDDDPDFEMTPKAPRAKKKAAASKKLSQSVDCSKTSDDELFDIDERSSSPLLFESDEEDEAKRTRSDVSARMEVSAGKRPLFKNKTNLNKEDKNLVDNAIPRKLDSDLKEENKIVKTEIKQELENIPPLVQDQGSEGNETKNSSTVTHTPNPKDPLPINTTREPDLEKSGEFSQAPVACKTKRVGGANLRFSSKRPAKGIHYDSDMEDEEELVTKRARNKRRRVMPVSAHVQELLEEAKYREKDASSLAVCCKKCGIRLTKNLDGVREEALPGYVTSVLPNWDQRKMSKMTSVCDHEMTCLKTCQPIDANTSTGVRLSSVWSEEEGCCLVLYRCPSSQCGPVPVAARVAAVTAASRAVQGQVWFVPHLTTTSEPS